MIPKGSRLLQCGECGRKRYCTITVPRSYWRSIKCSQGHTWEYEVGDMNRVVEIQMERILPRITHLFESESPFYKALKK